MTPHTCVPRGTDAVELRDAVDARGVVVTRRTATLVDLLRACVALESRRAQTPATTKPGT